MKISKEKKDKIAEQILLFLYQSFPKAKFTSEVAFETARDEEFIKNLLFELKDRSFVQAIKKNEEGKDFIRRIRWQLSPKAYQAYDSSIKGPASTNNNF